MERKRQCAPLVGGAEKGGKKERSRLVPLACDGGGYEKRKAVQERSFHCLNFTKTSGEKEKERKPRQPCCSRTAIWREKKKEGKKHIRGGKKKTPGGGEKKREEKKTQSAVFSFGELGKGKWRKKRKSHLCYPPATTGGGKRRGTRAMSSGKKGRENYQERKRKKNLQSSLNRLKKKEKKKTAGPSASR